MLSDVEEKAARESRKHLAQMRCRCGECRRAGFCDDCDAAQPYCQLRQREPNSVFLVCKEGCER